MNGAVNSSLATPIDADYVPARRASDIAAGSANASLRTKANTRQRDAAFSGPCRRQAHALREGVVEQCITRTSAAAIDFDRFTTGFYSRVGKRVIDSTLAGCGLLALSPVMLLVALAIRIDSKGPILFRQSRTGRWGRRFQMYKFRTMVADAEELKEELRAHNVHGIDSPDFKVIDDPRITRLGKFLRRTSLDELPNLFNVLLGQMSLVGPRPTSFHGATYNYQHLPRLAVKPGITGLWQVSGRADVGFDERTQLDITYINNISFGYDLKLLLRTLITSNRGAY